MGNTQRDFEKYQSEKYKRWISPSGLKHTDEKDSFDAYVKSIGKKHEVLRIKDKPIFENFQGYVKQNYGKGDSTYGIDIRGDRNGDINPEDVEKANTLKKDDYVTLVFPGFNNPPSGVTSGFLSGLIKEISDNKLRIMPCEYGTDNLTPSGGGSGVTPEQLQDKLEKITGETRMLDAGESPYFRVEKASDNISIKVGVPQSKGGGGGGDITPEIVISQDTTPNKITGDYGVNFFNYRDLTQNTDLMVNGRKFTNRRPSLASKTYQTVFKDYNRTVRIRKNDKLFFKYRFLKSTKPSGLLEFNIIPKEGGHGEVLDISISCNQSDKYKWKDSKFDASDSGHSIPNNYSYACYNLGTKQDSHDPSTSTVEVQGWYGGIKPEGLTQSFEFKNHMGYELRGMANFSQSYAKNDDIKDEYHIYKRRTEILRKVGILKLKDVKEWYYGEGKKYIYIPIPEDCKESAPALMSNNLCDITTQDGEGKKAENQPFFLLSLDDSEAVFNDVRYISPDAPSKGLLLDENGKPIPDKVVKKCFVIQLGKEYLSKWKYLLDKTEILYELKTPKPEQIPVGGQIYVLNNGTKVHTCLYKTVAPLNEQGKGKAGKYIIKLSESPFGLPDLQVMVENIVDVIDASGYNQIS